MLIKQGRVRNVSIPVMATVGEGADPPMPKFEESKMAAEEIVTGERLALLADFVLLASDAEKAFHSSLV